MTGPTAPDPGDPAQLPDQPEPRRRTATLVGGLAVAVLVAAGTTWVALDPGSGTGTPVSAATATGSASAPAAAAPVPVVSLAGSGTAGGTPYATPFVLSAVDGAITGVEVTEASGAVLTGALGQDGSWRSTGAVFPATGYALRVAVRDAAGRTSTQALTTTTAAHTGPTLTAGLSPGDDKVVGIGQAVAVRLGTPVPDPAARAAVEASLSVTTTPAVEGAWRWMDDGELHYRGADFWAPGTTISVVADFTRLALPDGTYGEGVRTSTFTVGDPLTAVVDVQAHTMTVSRGTEVLRTMRASMGRPGFDTRGGTFVVLEKFEDKVMDGSTLATPADYSTAVKHAVRISNSGTFTHGAPWSVASQGVTNVSHGCINLAPADAQWYFEQAKRGDVVTVVNAEVGPLPYDAGSRDWNMSFAEWQAGSALS